MINKTRITSQILERELKKGIIAFTKRFQQELIDEISRLYQKTKHSHGLETKCNLNK